MISLIALVLTIDAEVDEVEDKLKKVVDEVDDRFKKVIKKTNDNTLDISRLEGRTADYHKVFRKIYL